MIETPEYPELLEVPDYEKNKVFLKNILKLESDKEKIEKLVEYLERTTDYIKCIHEVLHQDITNSKSVTLILKNNTEAIDWLKAKDEKNDAVADLAMTLNQRIITISQNIDIDFERLDIISGYLDSLDKHIDIISKRIDLINNNL